MSEENIAVMRGVYEAFGRGDVPAVLGAFDEAIEWYESEGMPYGGLHRGPDSIAQNVFGPITSDIEGFTVTPQEFYAAGDEVVVIGTYTGKGSVSGSPLQLPVAHAWTVRDAKVTRFRQFVDAATFNAVLPAD